MSDDYRIPDELGEAYASALHALARADGEVGVEESAEVDRRLSRRTSVTVDAEAMFFDPPTPEKLAAKVRKHPACKDVGRALVRDAVALAIADGDLKSKEATAILRYAKALGLGPEEVHAESPLLDEWLHQLG